MFPLLCTLLAAAPMEPVKVAVPGVVATGIEQDLANAMTEKLVVLAKRPELSIVTARDITTMLGIERQRQLLGCDDAGCMTELVGAMGAEVLLRGEVIKAGNSITLIIKAIRARDGREVASGTVRAKNVDAVQDWIEVNAPRIGDEIVLAMRGRPESGGPGWLRFVALGGGGLIAATGGLLLGLAYQTLGALQSPATMTADQINGAVSTGRNEQLVGIALLATGGAIAALSAVLFAVHDPGTRVSVALLPNGGALSFTVALP